MPVWKEALHKLLLNKVDVREEKKRKTKKQNND